MNGREWTSDTTAKLKRMVGANYRISEIAEAMGYAEITIRTRIKALGLAPCRRADWLIRYCSEFNRRSHAFSRPVGVALRNGVRPSA